MDSVGDVLDADSVGIELVTLVTLELPGIEKMCPQKLNELLGP
jgi:hypothetical protein